MKKISSRLRISISTLIAVLAPALIVYAAALTNLNGVTTATQNFVNDTNVTMISSAGASTHTLGWIGALATSRGGTGTTTWQTGSIPFFDGTIMTEDFGIKYYPSGIGLINPGSLVLGAKQTQANIIGAYGDATDPVGKTLSIQAGNSIGTSDGGALFIGAGDGGEISGNAGDLNIATSDGVNGDGGDISITAGTGSGGGHDGKIKIKSGHDGGFAILNTEYVGDEATFTFTSQDGTIAVLHGSASSTIQLGDIKSCIVMADSDGSGLTYVTANDGVLTATTTQPTNCQ